MDGFICDLAAYAGRERDQQARLLPWWSEKDRTGFVFNNQITLRPDAPWRLA